MYGYDILHKHIAENLIQNVRMRENSHAYIFSGERGVGSLECAKLMAAAMVCEKQSLAPCGVCPGCIMAKAGTHPDIYTVSPADGKKNISVDRIRSVVQDAYTKPYESGKKVYIIAYGDDMNEQAQNAFLKVLEEPPEYAVFIVLAENDETLLATIRSRCILVKFSPVGKEKVREYIEKNYPDAENKDFLIQYSGGIVGEIEKIVNTEGFAVLREESLYKIESLLSNDKLKAYEIAEFVEENKEDADLILRFWQGFLRDIMLIQNGMEKQAESTDYIDRLINLSGKFDEERIARAIEALLMAQKMRKRYVNLRTLMLRMAFEIKIKGESK